MSSSLGKRRRLNNNNILYVNKQNRLNKRLFVINEKVLTTTEHKTMHDATYPCTITGIRWSLTIQGPASGENDANFSWAIVITRDNNDTKSFNFASESNLYAPEQDVLAFGCCRLANADKPGPQTHHFEGSTKTMRKLQHEDQIKFVYGAESSDGHVFGCVQSFCKT